MTRRLYVAAGALALAPVLLLGPASLAATEDLPSSAVVKDPHKDGESRPLDVHRIKGAKVGDALVLTMTVNNLTRKNTKIEYYDGWYHIKTFFGVYLRVNGAKKIAFNVRNSFNGESSLAKGATGERIDCAPGDNDSYGTTLSMDFTKDLVRMSVPLSCLPDVKTVRVSGYTNDMRSGWKSDQVSAEPGGVVAFYSPEFSVE